VKKKRFPSTKSRQCGSRSPAVRQWATSVARSGTPSNLRNSGRCRIVPHNFEAARVASTCVKRSKHQ
jgi:hypothetical protein